MAVKHSNNLWVRMAHKHPEDVDLELGGDDVAGWFHFAAICYASRNLTDGFVPNIALPKLTNDNRWKKSIKVLAQAGWIIEVEGGIQVCGYTDYQRTKAQIEEEREENARRKAEWRARKKAAKASGHADVTEMSQRDNPVTHDGRTPSVTAMSRSIDTDPDPDKHSRVNNKVEDSSQTTSPSTLYVARARKPAEIDARRAKNMPQETREEFDRLRAELGVAEHNQTAA